jgi:hypothetical protein
MLVSFSRDKNHSSTYLKKLKTHLKNIRKVSLGDKKIV